MGLHKVSEGHLPWDCCWAERDKHQVRLGPGF